MNSKTKTTNIDSRIRQAVEENRHGEAQARLTLFKCACVRLTLPATPRHLAALDAMEMDVLGRITNAELREAVNYRFAGAQTVVMGLNQESPGAASAVALDVAVHESDSKSISTVVTMCLAWAQFTAKKFGENTSLARGEMQELMADALDRILEAETLDEAVAEVRRAPLGATCPVH